MNILVIGEQVNLAECRQKFGDKHEYSWVEEHRDAEKFLQSNGLVFDFIIEEEPHQFEIYCSNTSTVFLNTCKVSLGELVRLVGNPASAKIFGFNGFPTFLNRDVLEVSLWNPDDESALKKICEDLKTDFLLVDDRIGLVTPRVICMIINEAYYAVQDGTAGQCRSCETQTNYLWPFEWCDRMG
jgi:3-hydroxybutyryl-CoA dehydrogenase